MKMSRTESIQASRYRHPVDIYPKESKHSPLSAVGLLTSTKNTAHINKNKRQKPLFPTTLLCVYSSMSNKGGKSHLKGKFDILIESNG